MYLTKVYCLVKFFPADTVHYVAIIHCSVYMYYELPMSLTRTMYCSVRNNNCKVPYIASNHKDTRETLKSDLRMVTEIE